MHNKPVKVEKYGINKEGKVEQIETHTHYREPFTEQDMDVLLAAGIARPANEIVEVLVANEIPFDMDSSTGLISLNYDELRSAGKLDVFQEIARKYQL